MTVAPGQIRSRRRLAINRLIERRPLDGPAIDRFLERNGAPIVEGDRATFLWRGEADEVMVRHRVVGLPDPLPPPVISAVRPATVMSEASRE